jgi:polysaccharide export outer membrane protein
VEADGNIQLPYIGKIMALGLSRLQLQDKLTQLLKEYTQNPVVNVRFLNYNFSILGEVRSPGRKPMINERTTLLEAIALAGDISDFGKSDNILIIREDSGRRVYGRVNLLSKKIFESPYFYLKTNDVVYVEPVRTRYISRGGIPQYISIAAVGLSLILTILNVIKK